MYVKVSIFHNIFYSQREILCWLVIINDSYYIHTYVSLNSTSVNFLNGHANVSAVILDEGKLQPKINSLFKKFA